MNTNSSFTASQPPAQNHQSTTGNEIQAQQQNQLLSTIQATQQMLSQPQLDHKMNNNQTKIKSEPKPNPLRITTNNNPLFNGLLTAYDAQQTMFQFPSNNNNNINTNHNNPNHNHNHNHNHSLVSECRSVRDCASIKRIVKLGVFHLKYGTQKTNIIAQFMQNCTEFNALNDDYQHSIKHHLTTAHKQEIASMSTQYEKIYDFLDNFQRNNTASVQQLLFYNETMDTIYAGMDIKSEKVKQIKYELLDLITNDTEDNSTHNIHPVSMSFPSIIPVPLNNNIQSFPNLFSIQNMPTLPSLIPSINIPSSQPNPIPLIQSVIQPMNINPINTQFIPINPTQNVMNNYVQTRQDATLFSVVNAPKQSKKDVLSIQNMNTKSKVINKKNVKTRVQKQTYFNVKQQRKEQDELTRKFKCNFCTKQYKHLCNLKSHQKIHTDEALICPHCKKRFGRKANYKEHLRIHTGETPYQCQFCQRKFKHHHSWKDHIRIHTGEKPYSCAICKKRFKVGHNLTVHLRIHTGEKPYNCTVCMKTFRQKSALNSHLKRVHN